MNWKRKNKKEEKVKKIPKLAFGLSKDKEFFSENLSLLISSGTPLIESLRTIKIGVKTKVMKNIIDYIIDKVNNGVPLWRALMDTKKFSSNIISLVKIGEETGRLSENLNVIAVQEEKNRLFTSKLRSAMAYPVLIFIIASIVALLIAWFILPRLSTVFSQMDVELPFLTQMLINLGNFLQEYGTFVVPLILILLFTGTFFVFVYKKTNFIGYYILLKTPIIKNLIMQIEVARFSFLFGTLLKSGIPILHSVESLQKTSNIDFYKNYYKYLGQSINAGRSIESTFKDYKNSTNVLPVQVQQMIITGEKSGSLPDVLLKVSDIYEGKLDNTTKNLTVILEPILLVVVWLGVIFIALAVIMPIYSLIGGFNS